MSMPVNITADCLQGFIPPLRFGDVVARIPIVQGGMGVGVSLAGLASAVANQGGVGVISTAGIGMLYKRFKGEDQFEHNQRALSTEIRKAKDQTDGVIGVNIMTAMTDFAEMVKVAIEEKVDIIFSGAGLPLDLPKRLVEGARTKLAPIVSSERAAGVLCKKWLHKYDYLPDGFVVEGPLAGGHLGFKQEQIDDPDYALEKIVPRVVDTVADFEAKHGKRIPVIAAGGCYTGEDIVKFFQLGASGVQMGTRFVATHECDADEAFKQAYVEAKEEDIVIIKSPVGLPGRAIKNSFTEKIREKAKKAFGCPYHCIKTCTPGESPYCISLALLNAQRGLLQRGFAFAGKNAHRIDKIVSVKELFTELVSGYLKAACAGKEK